MCQVVPQGWLGSIKPSPLNVIVVARERWSFVIGFTYGFLLGTFLVFWIGLRIAYERWSRMEVRLYQIAAGRLITENGTYNVCKWTHEVSVVLYYQSICIPKLLQVGWDIFKLKVIKTNVSNSALCKNISLEKIIALLIKKVRGATPCSWLIFRKFSLVFL